jgi:hypothetical protein
MEYAATASRGKRVADARLNLAIVYAEFDHVTYQRELGEIGQYRSLDAPQQFDVEIKDLGHVTRPPVRLMMRPPAVFRRGLLSHAPARSKRTMAAGRVALTWHRILDPIEQLHRAHRYGGPTTLQPNAPYGQRSPQGAGKNG